MRRRAGHAAIGAVVLVFAIASAYSALRLNQQFGSMLDYLRTGSWMAAQANLEYLRLTNELAAFQLEPTPQRKLAMMDRLELFWSRLPLILDGDEGRYTRSFPGVSASIGEILRDLPVLERRLTALDGADTQAYGAAVAQLEGYRPSFQALMQSLLMDTASTAGGTVRRQHYESLAGFAVVVLAGGCLIVLLKRSLREAQAAEAEALQARQQLEDAIESISEGFVLYDKDERLVIANSQYKAFYPTIAQMVQPGVRLRDLLYESARLGQYDTRLDPDQWVARRIEQQRNPVGTFKQTLVDGRILRINDGRTRSGGIVSVRADITELVQAEALLSKRLSAIEAAPDGIAIVAADGHVEYANESFCALFGHTRNGLRNLEWLELFSPSERPGLRAKTTDGASTVGRWRDQASGLRADGSPFPVHAGFARLEDGVLILVVRDMTLEIQADCRRIELERQLGQAQKMEAIGRMAGGIAHDFNNILTAISGFAGFLVEDLPPGSHQHDFAENVVSAAQRAKELVQQLLAFSRSREVEREATDPATVIGETARLLRAMLPPTTGLSIDARAGGDLVWANSTQLGQVLMNLCVNAHDALSGRCGSIQVTLGGHTPSRRSNAQAPADAAAYRLLVGEPDPDRDYVRITVSDDGHGMTPDILERIFDPFFTTKPVGKGTGLGLAAVHGIVLAHHGLVEVATQPGSGTSFRLYLPAMRGASLPSALAVAIGRADLKGSGRVLVVDDQEQVATMTATSLERMGYDPAVCASGEEAIEALSENPHAWDILLSDYLMPGMNGLDLARRAKQLRRDLPVVLCSGYADDLTEDQMRSVGVLALLHKPIDGAKLAATLRTALVGT